MSVIEDDEETQKRGIVAIVWWMHHPLRLDQDFDNDLRQETIASLNWLPMRPYSSTHVCIDYNHATMKQIMARFMMAVSPKNMRYGIQLHSGTCVVAVCVGSYMRLAADIASHACLLFMFF